MKASGDESAARMVMATSLPCHHHPIVSPGHLPISPTSSSNRHVNSNSAHGMQLSRIIYLEGKKTMSK